MRAHGWYFMCYVTETEGDTKPTKYFKWRKEVRLVDQTGKLHGRIKRY